VSTTFHFQNDRAYGRRKKLNRQDPNAKLEGEERNYDAEQYQSGLLQKVLNHVFQIKQFPSEEIHVVIEVLKALATLHDGFASSRITGAKV
jgi:ribonuclease PH